MGVLRSILLAGLALAVVASPAGAATLEPVGSFSSPIFVTSYPDDPDRLLVVERAGTVRLVTPGGTSTFLDVTARVGTVSGEEGLLSIALAPDFAATGRLYAFYAGSGTSGDLQIDEFTAAGDSASSSTRRAVITIPHPTNSNHNGGQLQFGPDGYLYASTGDGGGGGDPDHNAQDLGSPLGKVLRIDPRQSGADPYTVPADNPFVATAGARPEIWSLGLRNPFRFSFDRETGAIAIGDVGQGSWEEVDWEPGPSAGCGDNYGWSCREGMHAYSDASPDPACASPPTFTEPIHEYGHSGGNCSITGGYVVRDQSLGDLYGRYVYADFCAGQVRSLVPGLPLASGDRSEGLAVANPSSFGEDSCGRVYVVSLGGQVSRLAGATAAACGASPGAGGPAAPQPGGDGSTPGEPAAQDTRAPRLKLVAERRQRLGRRPRLVLVAKSGEAAIAELDAKLRAKPRGKSSTRGAKRIHFRAKTRRLEAGEQRRVKWRLQGRKLRRARAFLRDELKLRAVFTGQATDTAGNAATPVRTRSRLIPRR